MTADLLINRTIRFTFYEYRDSGIAPVFTYDQPYTEMTFNRQILYMLPVMEDSVISSVHPRYDYPGKFHRKLFGENYRKEWATPTKLPLIKISNFHGGLNTHCNGAAVCNRIHCGW